MSIRASTLLSAVRSQLIERASEADPRPARFNIWEPDDTIPGTPGDDTLSGTTGADTINGGAGADLMKGRSGADLYIVDNVGDVVQEGINKGKDTVKASVSYTLSDNVENLTLTGTAGLNGDGNALNNRIIGNNNTSGTNVLRGYDGNDTILGNGGDDIIYGGTGADSLNGGDGWARIEGEDGDDTIIGDGGQEFLGGAGSDSIMVNTAFTVDGGTGGDIIQVFVSASGIYGGDGDDWIDGEGQFLSGGLGDDEIHARTNHNGNVSGGAGNDLIYISRVDTTGPGLMSGGEGNDTLVGGALDARGGTGNDTYQFETFGSPDEMTIVEFVHGEDVIGIDQGGLPIGDGDTFIEGAVLAAAPGGFSSDAELVIRTTTGAIGNATSNYQEGDSAVFVQYDGTFRNIFYFQSMDNDALVEADELTLIGRTTHALVIDDFVIT